MIPQELKQDPLDEHRVREIAREEIAKSAEEIANLAIDQIKNEISKTFNRSSAGVYDDTPESLK